jgi:hypothetical protein
VNNIDLIKELYRTFREQDYDAFLDICTADLEWMQNEGFPNGKTHRGAAEVIQNVFEANRADWIGFSYEIEDYLDAGNAVVVVGRYVGRNRMTGKPLDAAATHIYDLRDGKVCRFRMFADTKTIWNAMT